jgi:hypothetical protein
MSSWKQRLVKEDVQGMFNRLYKDPSRRKKLRELYKKHLDQHKLAVIGFFHISDRLSAASKALRTEHTVQDYQETLIVVGYSFALFFKDLIDLNTLEERSAIMPPLEEFKNEPFAAVQPQYQPAPLPAQPVDFSAPADVDRRTFLSDQDFGDPSVIPASSSTSSSSLPGGTIEIDLDESFFDEAYVVWGLEGLDSALQEIEPGVVLSGKARTHASTATVESRLKAIQEQWQKETDDWVKLEEYKSELKQGLQLYEDLLCAVEDAPVEIAYADELLNQIKAYVVQPSKNRFVLALGVKRSHLLMQLADVLLDVMVDPSNSNKQE